MRAAQHGLDPDLVAVRRAEIAEALKGKLPLMQHRRLRAIDAFLLGEPCRDVAQKMGIQPVTVDKWVRLFVQGGLRALPQQRVVLPVTEAEIQTALEVEIRPGMRKRLGALLAVIRGETFGAAGRVAEVSACTVDRWCNCVRAGGLPAVLAIDTRRAPLRPGLVAAARAEIAAVLERKPPSRMQTRLRALDAALAGGGIEAAADLGQVKPSTVGLWLRQVRKLGITVLLTRWRVTRNSRRPKIDADAAGLRRRAASEKDRHVRKRLLALANVAEGVSVDDAAVQARISTHTIRAIIRKFQQGGIAALCNKPYAGPGPKLRPHELEAVVRLARAVPPPSFEQLRARVQADFGVCYTAKGFKNMLKKQLGINCSARTSIADS